MGLLTGSKPSRALRNALAPMKADSHGYYEPAVAYVHSGEQAEVLLALEQAKSPVLNALLAFPGQLKNWSTTVTGPPGEALKKVGVKPDHVESARSQFYGSAATPDEFVRFGKLLAAIATDVNRTAEGVPTWLTALLNDVASTFAMTGNDDLLQHQVAKRLPSWRAEFVATLATEDDVPEPELVALLALCQRSPDVWAIHRLLTYLLPGVDEFLAANAWRLSQALVGRLTGDARAFLAERAEEVPAVAEALAAILAVDSAKGVRTAALRALATLPVETRARVLPPVLAKAPAARAGGLVEWLGRDEAGAALLADAVASGAKIGALVEQAAQRREALDVRVPDVPLEVPPFQPISDEPAGQAVITELRRVLDAAIARGEGATEEYLKTGAQKARSVTQSELGELVRAANGQADKPKLLKKYNVWWVTNGAPSLNLVQVLRLWKDDSWWFRGAVRSRTDADTDLRVIADAIARAQVEVEPTDFVNDPVSPEAAWPYFADHIDILESWLAGSADKVTSALSVLAHFPSLPASVVPKVAAVALGDSRTNRPLAQKALLGHPAAQALAAQGLRSSKGEVRAAAADWLSKQNDPATTTMLRAALVKEKRELVRAALLTALESLGDDISGDLAPAVLLAEAIKGLKSARPSSMEWFLADTIPVAHWVDGSIVDSRVLAWWFVLAVKLKEPNGSGLIDRYLSMLAPDDAAEIGRHALRSWIAQDIRHPSEQESRAHAATSGQQTWQHFQDRLARIRQQGKASAYTVGYVEEQAGRTLEDHITDAFRTHQAIYAGSAAADKGMLALTTRMPGIELADAVQAYIRNHGRRRAQVEYLVTALYANGQTAAVQLLLSISRRFKQASVQAKALDYVQRIAEASGWTPDELADRTIPTAGFGEDRLLHLDFGPREFLGRVGPKATIKLSDAVGSPLKALPSPRASDDEELVSEAKKQLTTSRKELKSVLGLQTSRLYEAMCLQRTWAAADWQEFLAAHPLVSQLITGLIWLENPGPEQRGFRPTEDGELIGTDDEPIDLVADSRIGLAHSVLLTPTEVDAWRAHLADYAVDLLFDQLSAASVTFAAGATEMADLRGHMTDTFTFRGVATKRGYSRGGAEDGGWFSEYIKAFSGVGLVAEISFTGSYVPEENIPCATETLRFTQRRRSVLLADVPPVLLAECYADYAALAALGPYDRDYLKKSGI